MSQVKQLGQYKGIEAKVKKIEVTEEQVEQQIQMILMQNPLRTPKDGDVENGDVTIIDFEGLKDGVAFEGGTAKGYELEIGSGSFIPGFEEQMIGMKKGETRDLNLTFPENYQMEDLAGADVIFKVTVHEIMEKKEATLNDEFVQSLNVPNMNTVDDLKEQLRQSIQQQHDQTYRTNVENAIFEQLLNNSEVTLDDADIEKAMNEHIQHLRMDLARQGMQLENYLQMMGATIETLQEQLKPSAEQQAKFEAIIDEIVKVENLTTSDEEIDQQVDMIAQQNQMTKEEVLEKVNPEDLKHDFNRIKASQLVIQSAVITE